MIRRVVVFLKAIRALESTLMVGFPLIGTFFALTRVTGVEVVDILKFLPSTYGLVIYVYALNSWGGIETDRANARLGHHPVLTGDITAKQLLVVAFVGLAVSFFLYLVWLPRCFPIALAIFAVWTLYSHPSVLAKGRPIWGSVIHFTGGILQFLLGWIVVRDIDAPAVALALFFAGVFAAGHLNHEVKDHDADKAIGLRTNAVVFGPRRMLNVALAVFGVFAAYLVVVSLRGLIDWSLSWPFVAIFPLHVLAHFSLRPRPPEVYRRSYQVVYRTLYVAAGLVTLTTQLFSIRIG